MPFNKPHSFNLHFDRPAGLWTSRGCAWSEGAGATDACPSSVCPSTSGRDRTEVTLAMEGTSYSRVILGLFVSLIFLILGYIVYMCHYTLWSRLCDYFPVFLFYNIFSVWTEQNRNFIRQKHIWITSVSVATYRQTKKIHTKTFT